MKMFPMVQPRLAYVRAFHLFAPPIEVPMIRTLCTALALSVLSTAANAQALAVVPDPAPVSSNVLMISTQDITGAPLAYPDGDTEITVEIVTLEPGAETGWHLHPVPLFARIETGTLTVDYGSRGLRTYNPGDVMLEAVNWPHNGHNHGTETVTLLAVFFGTTSAELAVPATQQ